MSERETESETLTRVPRAEFVALMIASGVSPDEAEMQAKLAAVLGSHVRIGQRMVGIEK